MPEPNISGFQAAIDRFDRSVTSLNATAEKLATLAGTLGSGDGVAITAQSNQKPPTGFAAFTKSMGAAATSNQAAFTKTQAAGSDGASAQRFSGQQQGGSGGHGGFLAGIAARGGTSGGGLAGAGASVAPSAGMAAAGFGASVAGAIKSPMGMAATAGTIAGAGIGALASFGQASLPSQVAISSYTRSQSLFGMSSQTSRNLAYGSNGNNLNMLGQSPADASAGQSTINSIGNYDPSSQRFQTAQGGANAIGIANPGQSYSQDANFMAVMTDPQMNRALNMSGIQDTMLQRGGKTDSLANEQSAIMKRLTGKTSMSQTDFNAKIGGLNSSGNQYLQDKFGADIAAELTASFALQNRLSQGMNAAGKTGANPKMNNTDITNLLTDAAKGKQKALDTLKKYGAPESDIQAIQRKNAVSTATQADLANDFTSGLVAATTALGGLDKFLEKILNIPGVKQVAEVAGFLGTAESFLGFSGGGTVHDMDTLPVYYFSPGGTIPADLGNGIGPSQSQMVDWFGGIGDASNDTTVPFAGVTTQVNKKVAGTVKEIGDEIGQKDPGYVTTAGGFRTSIGATTSNIPYSMHQLGLAIDINAADNPYLGNSGTIVKHPKVIKAFEDHGWYWGGNWGAGGRDQQHFQLEMTNGMKAGGGSAGTSTSTSKSKSSSSSASGGGGGGGAPSSISEAANVASALGGGGGGGGSAPAKETTKATSTGGSGSGGGGAKTGDYVTIAKALMSVDGFNKKAAAGAVGAIAGESGGNPEILQSGTTVAGNKDGGGLIQWTPISAHANFITGNASKDMATQIPAIKTYVESRGLGGVKALNASSSPQAAATLFSKMLAPAAAGSDIVSSVVTSTYAKLASGTSQSFPAPSQKKPSGSNTVNLTVANGSIVSNGTSKTSASHSSREFITVIKDLRKSEDLYAAIANGDH